MRSQKEMEGLLKIIKRDREKNEQAYLEKRVSFESYLNERSRCNSAIQVLEFVLGID